MATNAGGSGGCQPPGYVPAQYRAKLCSIAQALGIPVGVVAAQINLESGFNAGAVSPSNAQGIAQFLPSTFSGEGCAGTPFNATDGLDCYQKYMGSLLKQEHGNVRNALAAYNAGPGNIQAGMGYANTILTDARQPGGLTSTGVAAGGGGATGQAAGNITGVCLVGFSSSGLAGTSWINDIVGTGGNIGQGQLCILRKSQARALIGGSLMGPALGLALVGVAVLAYQTTAKALGPAGKVAGGTAEVAGAGLAAVGLPEVGAPLAAAGSGVKTAARGRQGRAGKYATDRRAARRKARGEDAAEDAELNAKGASDIKTARKPQTSPPRPGRVTERRPGPNARGPADRPRGQDRPPF